MMIKCFTDIFYYKGENLWEREIGKKKQKKRIQKKNLMQVNY